MLLKLHRQVHSFGRCREPELVWNHVVAIEPPRDGHDLSTKVAVAALPGGGRAVVLYQSFVWIERESSIHQTCAELVLQLMLLE